MIVERGDRYGFSLIVSASMTCNTWRAVMRSAFCYDDHRACSICSDDHDVRQYVARSGHIEIASEAIKHIP